MLISQNPIKSICLSPPRGFVEDLAEAEQAIVDRVESMGQDALALDQSPRDWDSDPNVVTILEPDYSVDAQRKESWNTTDTTFDITDERGGAHLVARKEIRETTTSYFFADRIAGIENEVVISGGAMKWF